MEKHEINILEIIHKYGDISQREISNQSGISLGLVNMLLKKFVKVGMIKTERLNGNKIKYMLTPQGFSFLTRKTVDFVMRSYQAVLKIRTHIQKVILEHYTLKETVKIYGNQDEVSEILKDVLQSKSYPYQWITSYTKGEKFVHWESGIEEGIFLFDRFEI